MEGPDKRRENSLSTVAEALASGFAVETDIRFTNMGVPYISHDRVDGPPEHLADEHVELWSKYPDKLIALNIKETGFEEQTLSLLRRFGRLQNTVLFDMELIEREIGQTAIRYQTLDATCTIAARVSDRAESINRALTLPGTHIWLDEMDGMWVQRPDVVRLKEAGRTILAVSRDLHGVPAEQCEERWEQLADFGVDGICTDWPRRLENRLRLNMS